MQGGGTNTHLALDDMTLRRFDPSNGARPLSEGHPRVGIVVTDGQSAVPPITVMSALRAHDADITMFAVGIGDKIDLNELAVIASKPTCIHLFLLSDFEEVESLKYAIEKGTCEGTHAPGAVLVHFNLLFLWVDLSFSPGHHQPWNERH